MAPAAAQRAPDAARGGKQDQAVGRLAVQVEAMNLDRVDSGASSSASSCGSIPEHMRHIVVPQLGPRDVHPYHAAATPSKAAFKASPHYPVVMTTNPMVAEQRCNNNSSDVAAPLPVNDQGFDIDTGLFKGRIQVHLRGLPTTKDALFRGKKRYFHVALQGRFKRPVKASSLCMGQELLKGNDNIPPWLGEMVLTAVAKSFSNSTQVDVRTAIPHFMNPALAACQLVNVSKPGKEPKDMMAAQEDMRLWDSALQEKSGAAMTADKRRKWCDVATNLEGKTFTTEHVWTIHIWQHLIDFSQYKLNLGGWVSLDLCGPLQAQPLQLTAKDQETNDYVFSLLVWHEKLIHASDSELSTQSAMFDKISRVGSGFGGFFKRS